MNIVVIGLGEVGRHLLSVLDKEGHDIVAVDSSPKAVQYAEEHYDVASMVGYGASETLLKIAGVARAVRKHIAGDLVRQGQRMPHRQRLQQRQTSLVVQGLERERQTRGEAAAQVR